MRAALALFHFLGLFQLYKCTATVHLDVSSHGTPGSGFFMRPFYPVLNDTSLQEWPLVVLPGLHSVAANYGPFAAESDSVAFKLFTSAGGHGEIFGVQYVSNYAISAHLSTDVLTILQPRLQVVFHMGHATDDATVNHDFQQIGQLCAVMFIQKESEELMSTCIVDVTSPESLCVASAVLPYHWWHSTLNHSASVYYSVFSVSQEHHCAAVGSTSGIKMKTYEWFADSAREKQSYVGPVNLSASLASYEELREDQHLLIYVPTAAVSSRSVFHVPMKLQAASDLQIFVVRMKCRKGLRVLGADISSLSSWQITVDVSQKRRSATVTASTSADTADKLAHSVQELFSWLIEVDGSVEDGDRGRMVFTLEYEMTQGRKGVYAPVTNKAVAFVTFRHDSTLAVMPVIKTTELVNTALLSEHIVSWPMNVYLLTHAGRATDVTMQSTCHSQDERVLKVSVTCDLVYFDGTEARGASDVGVLVRHGSNVRTMNFRVWIPELPLDVVLSDNRLSAVAGWKIASSSDSVAGGRVTKDANGTSSECTKLRFQSSLVDVYARFVLTDARAATSYLLHRKAQFLVTDVVQSLLQVTDKTVARLRRNDKVIDGVQPGRTTVQVVQKSGRVIGSCELTVANDRVDVGRLDVTVVSGLSLSVVAKADFPGALSVHVSKSNLMHRRYQEALLDLTVHFDDGTSLPLSAIPDNDYTLMAETLNKDVIMLAPPHQARLVTITAVSPGSGSLIRVGLGIDSSCPVTKHRPLVAGFANVVVEFDEMVQSDASYYHQRDHDRFGPDLYSVPYIVSRDRVIYSRSDRNRKGRRRKGKGRQAAPGRGKSSSVEDGVSTTGLADGVVVVPQVEAQQQRQEPVVEAPHRSASSLELALYILLAVFSVSVVVFAANCLLFVIRRGRKQKLTEPKDPVLEARDWVWIGPATLQRNEIITSCGRRLMSDEKFSSSQSSRPNSAITPPSNGDGSNRNSTVSTYRGSECSVRITANPLADDNGNIMDGEPVPPVLQAEEYFLDEARIERTHLATAADDDDDEMDTIDDTDDEGLRSTEEEMIPQRGNDRFIRPLSSAWSTMSREDQLRELEEAVASGLNSDWDCEGFGMTYAELMEYFDNLRESMA